MDDKEKKKRKAWMRGGGGKNCVHAHNTTHTHNTHNTQKQKATGSGEEAHTRQSTLSTHQTCIRQAAQIKKKYGSSLQQ
jgi:hypothetical protein